MIECIKKLLIENNIDTITIDIVIFQVLSVFSEAVLKGNRYIVDYSYDPPWDCSGSICEDECDDLLVFFNKKYKTIGEWSDGEYNGESIPSWCSGCGLFHVKYSKMIDEIIEDYVYNLLNVGDDESDELFDLGMKICRVIQNVVSEISLDLAWDMTHKKTNKRLEKERADANEKSMYDQKLFQLSRDITKKYFSDFLNYRIDAKNKTCLIKYFAKIKNCLSFEEFVAISRYGVKLNISNKVDMLIKELAKTEIMND